MEIFQALFLVMMFSSCAQSRPWLKDSETLGVSFQQQRSVRAAGHGGPVVFVEQVCKTVVTPPQGLSHNTAVHLCQNGIEVDLELAQ